MKDGWPAVNNLDELANAIMFCDVEGIGHEKGADLIETQANYRTPPRICSRNSLGRQLERRRDARALICLPPTEVTSR